MSEEATQDQRRSPLGRYAPAIASIAAVGVLGLWAVAELLYGLGYLINEPSSIRTAALVTLGAVFGGATFVRPSAPEAPPPRGPRRAGDAPEYEPPLPEPSKK